MLCLRLLPPALGPPLPQVRDNAIIFTMEYVRLIVTADKVLVPREGYEHNPLANRCVLVLSPLWQALVMLGGVLRWGAALGAAPVSGRTSCRGCSGRRRPGWAKAPAQQTRPAVRGESPGPAARKARALRQ